MSGRWKEPSRDGRLQRLKAFGLFVRGEHTYYQIAEALGIAESNPSTAAGRARTRIEQGWRIIVERRVPRWDAYWSAEFPHAQWQVLHGARLDTHPRRPPEPPKPPPTPFESLLARIADAEQEARSQVGRGYGFVAAADGLRNLAAALRHNFDAAGAPQKAGRSA